MVSPAGTVELVVPGPPPPPDPHRITPELRAALLDVIRWRVTSSRNRLDAVATNFPPQLRARSFPLLADNLEAAVADVIGHAADPSRPGALGRMLAEVERLLTEAEDV